MPLNYRPGQHILIWRNPTSSRRFCLLSQPEQDNELLIHIERRAGSHIGSWLFDGTDIGTKVTLSELSGSCYYQPERYSGPMIILGSGVGIGSAMAITRDVLTLSPKATIATLLHSDTDTPESFYLQDYPFSTSKLIHITSPNTTNTIDELLADRLFQQANILLMGNADTVLSVQRHLIGRGISKSRVNAQPFVMHSSE